MQGIQREVIYLMKKLLTLAAIVLMGTVVTFGLKARAQSTQSNSQPSTQQQPSNDQQQQQTNEQQINEQQKNEQQSTTREKPSAN